MKKENSISSKKQSLSKYDEKIRQIRKMSRYYIQKLLEKKPMSGKDLSSKVKEKYPEYCNNDVKCQCGKGENANRHEWEHQVQWAIQDLKYGNIIIFDKAKGLYSIKKIAT